MSSPIHRPSIAIIGTGFGGLATAIALQKEGVENFTIFEKASEVGGTWRENTYPGATSDINIFYYSLSTDLKADWERTCTYQPKILTYIKEVVEKHQLAKHIVFNSKVTSCEWDSTSQTYTVTNQDIHGAQSTQIFNIVISANGPLHVPKFPNIPGLADFKGSLMHSAEWDKSIDLRGKRVGLIGNGSSGSQILGHIADIDGIKLTQFVRSQNWLLPSMAFHPPAILKWLFRTVPFLPRLYRYAIFCFSELLFLMMFKTTAMRGPLVKVGKTYLLNKAPKEYHRFLVPDFPVGCRRVIFEDRYLSSLHLPNVTLKDGGNIGSIAPEGIVTKDGEKLPFDVLICATGFVADAFPFHVRGVDETLQKFNEKHNGPTAYLGAAVPGFPNFYTIMGPNTATGYTSVVFFIENQVSYLMQLIKPVLEGRVSSFEITPEANDEYNKKIQGMFTDSVWTFCRSWYLAAGTGKNVIIFPGSATQFWWWCRNVVWSHYKVIGADGKPQKDYEGGSSSGLTAVVVGTLFAIVAWWATTL